MIYKLVKSGSQCKDLRNGVMCSTPPALVSMQDQKMGKSVTFSLLCYN